MYNALIVENESAIFKFIVNALAKLRYFNVFISTTEKEALKIASDTKMDIFIIGLEFGLNDFHLLQILRKRDYRRTPIIIVSLNDDLVAQKQFYDNNIFYLTKPLSEKKLIQKVNTAIENNRIVKVKNYSIDIENVLFIEKISNINNLLITSYNPENNLKKTKKLIRVTLDNIIESLEFKCGLYRCHRSIIVNLNNIAKVEGNNIYFDIIDEGKQISIPIGKTLQKNFKIEWENYCDD